MRGSQLISQLEYCARTMITPRRGYMSKHVQLVPLNSRACASIGYNRSTLSIDHNVALRKFHACPMPGASTAVAPLAVFCSERRASTTASWPICLFDTAPYTRARTSAQIRGENVSRPGRLPLNRLCNSHVRLVSREGACNSAGFSIDSACHNRLESSSHFFTAFVPS